MKDTNNHVRGEILDVADDVATDVREAGETAMKAGEDVARTAGKTARRRWNTLWTAAREQSAASKKVIQKSPIKSLAIALGLGLVIGALLKPRD